jgi:hypothetical protein
MFFNSTIVMHPEQAWLQANDRRDQLGIIFALSSGR